MRRKDNGQGRDLSPVPGISPPDRGEGLYPLRASHGLERSLYRMRSQAAEPGVVPKALPLSL